MDTLEPRMKSAILHVVAASMVCLVQISSSHAEELPDGYWTLEQATEVLDRTRLVELTPDLSHLRPGEQEAVVKLLLAGRLLNAVYEDSLHPQALSSLEELQLLDDGSERTRALLDLFYLFKGPIATTLDNQRVPFLPVSPTEPGKNVYPAALSRGEFDAFLEENPELRYELMNSRTVVRANTGQNLARDLEMLARYPLLDGLHPDLRTRLEGLRSGSSNPPWYALPYSVRWAPRVMDAYGLLLAAAEDVRTDDPDLSAYLGLRARDLVSDNYEGGDAAWVTGRFGNLNAQIGSYETYDDALYGVRSFFSLSVLARDEEKSRELEAAIGDIQAIQDSLPQKQSRKVADSIPIGVYNVIADFGQSRSANTASILPNDAAHARKYGRTILLRYNIMTNPDLFADTDAVYRAAVAEENADDLSMEGGFYRTLWHEIGHYLGVATTADGRDLGEALSPWSDLYEEMKADLVSLHTAPQLERLGIIDKQVLKEIYAGGIRRVLQRVQPRSDQPYQTMQLMQMNYFLENRLLTFDPDTARLTIHYDRYASVVESLLEKVLAIQSNGDVAAAAAFRDKYITWDENLHGMLATNLVAATPFRYRMVRYEALETPQPE
jgi:hypothetical protein